ncbi:hypothetical protein PHMEG_00015820 [Phytophthora megakarya]|uniref:MULE transposase domain-containing protein n=1 Tax=Phytophthora megakarya TaxID=4795 RepID=A0A225W1E2_9STRA|nr:hypothetical protein PHMEG_00015820 [Phytophthora megakarya]
MPQHDPELLLQSFILFKVSKSNLRPCNVCSELTAHNKRSQLLSWICATASPYSRCPWRGKLETCEELKIVTLVRTSRKCAPQTPRLTASMKAFARELAIRGLNPSRIQNGITRRFDVDMRTLPKLSTVQRYGGNNKKRHLGFNDFNDLVEAKVKAAAYIGSEEDNVLFGWRKTMNAKPHVGKGTDADPFFVASRQNGCYNPLQRSQNFRIASSLCRAFFRVVGVPQKVNYVMTDAEAAMYSVFEGVFAADNNNYINLMCWDHGVAKVYQHPNTLPITTRAGDMADRFAMYFARGQPSVTVRENHTLAVLLDTWWIRQNKQSRDYTHCRPQKVGGLITLLLSCFTVESMKVDPFWEVFEYVPKKSSITFHVDDPLPPAADGVLLALVSTKLKSAEQESKFIVSAQEGIHTARMVNKDMPSTDWEVDTTQRWYPCSYFFKFDHCIHLGYVLRLLGIAERGERQTLYFRGPKRAQRNNATIPGRPTANRHALDKH